MSLCIPCLCTIVLAQPERNPAFLWVHPSFWYKIKLIGRWSFHQIKASTLAVLSHLHVDLLVNRFEEWAWIILKFVCLTLCLSSGINLFHSSRTTWKECNGKQWCSETGVWLFVPSSQSDEDFAILARRCIHDTHQFNTDPTLLWEICSGNRRRTKTEKHILSFPACSGKYTMSKYSL